MENRRNYGWVDEPHNFGDERMAWDEFLFWWRANPPWGPPDWWALQRLLESRRCLHPTLLQETEETNFLAKSKKHVITKQTGKKSVTWLKNSQNLSQSWDVVAKTWTDNHFFQLVPSCWSFLYDFMWPFFGWWIFAKSAVCLRWNRSTSRW